MRYTDPSGYQKIYLETPYFNEGYQHLMEFAGGGGTKGFMDDGHYGSISYNWTNGKYEYANGTATSYAEAMLQIYSRYGNTGNISYYNYSSLRGFFDHLAIVRTYEGNILGLAGALGGKITGVEDGLFTVTNGGYAAMIATGNMAVESTAINLFDFTIDWAGAGNATLGMFGGIAEMGIGGAGEYFSGGAGTPVCVPLIVDGGYRTGANFTRLVAYLSGNKKFGDAMPSNIGATIGKGIDMMAGVPASSYGLGQGLGGFTNDFLTFISTGGNLQVLSDFQEIPTTMNGFKIVLSYTGNFSSGFTDLYPLKK